MLPDNASSNLGDPSPDELAGLAQLWRYNGHPQWTAGHVRCIACLLAALVPLVPHELAHRGLAGFAAALHRALRSCLERPAG